MSKILKPSPRKNGDYPPGPSIRKRRFGFTIAKDIDLLKAAIKDNSWKLDDWKGVSDALQGKYEGYVTPRTVRDRVNLLVKKHEAKELKSRAGTEEERSQRGRLLLHFIALREEAVVDINRLRGTDEVSFDEDIRENQSRGTLKTEETDNYFAGELSTERQETNEMQIGEALERDDADIANMGQVERREFTEDNAILVKLQHDMDMEKKRFEWECAKHRDESEIAKLRLELEIAQEQRLKAETQGSQERALAQLHITQQSLDLLRNLMKNFK